MRPTHHPVSDLRGASRLTIDAIAGITGVVQAMHDAIAAGPVRIGGPLIAKAVNGTTGIVYASVRGVTRVVGAGIDLALRAFTPAVSALDSPPARESVLAILNGVLGDHLAATANPLAIEMRLRRDGRILNLSRAGLAAALPEATSRIVVLVHGLCMSDLGWQRNGHDHGAALARDLPATPVYLHYNSGLHISINGRAFAEQLEALVAHWPVPIEALYIVAHSMGGLVTRSAHHCALAAGLAWPGMLRKLVFLGTPHHGAPLERGGHWVDQIAATTRYTAPLALLGQVRSAGITDLRYAFLRDEDWQGHDRFARRGDLRRPMPLPKDVECYAIAARLGPRRAVSGALVGDGLVPVSSALGRHRDAQFTLGFPPSHQAVIEQASHLDLLNHPEVYAHLLAWLRTKRPSPRRPRRPREVKHVLSTVSDARRGGSTASGGGGSLA
jgi:hypothetical protein